MADREEVIKGLEKVWDAFNHMEHELYADYVYDALELLKEQEPVKPHKIPHSITHPYGAYVCGNCNIRILEQDDDFCPNCGRAVKWDD